MKKLLLGAASLALLAGSGAIAFANRSAAVAAFAWTDGQKDAVYLRGNLTGCDWNSNKADYKFTFVGDTKDGSKDCADYLLTIKATAGNVFKIHDGEYRNAIVSSDAFNINGEGNIQVVTTGTYALHYRTNFSDVHYLYQIDAVDGEATRTIYFVNGYSWADANVKVHHYDNTGTGSTSPGDVMTKTNLRLKGYVGETEYANLGIFSFSVKKSQNWLKFSDNGSGETGALMAEDNGIYFYGMDAGVYNEVAKLIIDINDAMAAGSYDGRDYAKTICGMSKVTADGLISSYNTIVAKGGAYESGIKGSTIETNDYTKADGNTATYTVEEIIGVLSRTVSAGVTNPVFAPVNVTDSNATPVIVTIAVVSVSVAASAALFILRKKREQE